MMPLKCVTRHEERITLLAFAMLILASLYVLSRYNYLVFHTLAEATIIIVAGILFTITWNSRKFLDNNYLLIIGIAYLFVGIIEMLHLLAYSGMGVFPGGGTNLPTQLWLAARFVEAGSLLAAPFLADKRSKPYAIFAVYGAVTILILSSIFYWNNFPVTFIDGSGLTPFKIYGEYAIILALIVSLALLQGIRDRFERNVYGLLSLSIVTTALAELSFTAYGSPFDILNFAGHIFTLASFYLIYKAIIVTAIDKPHNIIFRSLKERERELEDAKAQAELYVDLMAHDINNMNQIGMGNLELAMESGSADMELLSKAHESLENSSRLIENVRKIQGAKERRLPLEPVDVSKMLEELSSKYAKHDGVTIRCQCAPGRSIMANDLLRDAFSNLIENSIKHAEGPVNILLELKESLEKGRLFYHISIEDNGPGIPDELKARLFQRLIRGNTKARGSGLGLYLVKTLVERFNGRIRTEDRVPGEHTQGARFVVVLPAMEHGQ